MATSQYRSGVPDDWFVDPVDLGVPGVRRDIDASEENTLAWQTDALCSQTDPEAFFPEKGGSTRDAKRICTSCDVKSECLEYALQNDERFGIWGWPQRARTPQTQAARLRFLSGPRPAGSSRFADSREPRLDGRSDRSAGRRRGVGDRTRARLG